MHIQTKSETPPMLPGALPVIGHSVQFQKKRLDFLRSGYEQHGAVFGVKLGPKNTVVLVGPEYQKFFYEETDNSLNMGKAYNFLEPVFGKVLFFDTFETYMKQRPILYEAFKHKKMLRYLPIMQKVINDWIDSLADEGRMNLTEEVVHTVQNVAVYALLGEKFMNQLGEEFRKHYKYIGEAIDPLIPPHWPIPKYIRRDKAKDALWAMIKPIIDHRRKHPEEYDDFLQDIINNRYEDGSEVEDDVIVGMVIGVIFAGHDTTAGQGAWTIIQLLQNPEYMEYAMEQVNQVVPYGTEIDGQKLSQLERMRWAVEETSRMRPSADLTLRFVDKDIEIGGYHVPAGWLAMLVTEIANFLPEVFENPHQYDPLRFSPERAEADAHRYSIVSFGGGMHRCAGMHFAKNEMAILAALFLQRLDVELETEDIQSVRGMGTSKPSETWVKYRKRKVSELVQPATIQEAVSAGCPHMQKMMEAEKVSS